MKTLIILIILSSFNFGQDAGKIFSLKDAENQFGNVIEEKILSTDAFKNVLQNTTNSVMFCIQNSELIILGDNRTHLYSSSSYSEENNTFHLFSKSKIVELLNLGESNNCLFQKREKAFTVQNGQFILELSLPCPPNCN
ncbi:MAG: hypothetical protein IPM32_16780 [Ignavibacteriae bacterium]|nr:hypothetical protein [Ignavibacteriota bacterium]